ncbi:L-threonine 3-dehydrogenase [Trametes elegans]|nr:L-threonine 3-dehydrogenase [Trametes elegans]
MKAIRYHGPGDVRLDNIPEPAVGPGEVKIKIAWCGLCGTDLHTYEGQTLGLVPSASEPHPITGDTLPIILGHEFSGTIVELGPGVDTSKFSVGQKVAVEPFVYCRKPDCPGCKSSDTRVYCQGPWVMGLSGKVGGLSEYVTADPELVHILPPNVSLEVGALLEPFAVAWRAVVKKARIKAGDKVLIQGAGPIAILILLIAKAAGASWIGVAGRRAKRCELARLYGATAVYDLTAPGVNVVAETKQATGIGADVVFDCAGSQESLDTALFAVRRGGTIVNVADWQKQPVINMTLVFVKDITLTNSLGYSNDHADALNAIATGQYGDLERLITRRVPLEDFLEKGLKGLINEKDEHVKILVHP